MKKKILYFLLLVSLLFFLLTIYPSIIFADNNDFVPAKWANPQGLRMQWFKSADDYFSSIMSGNFSKWNGIDSNICIIKYYYNSNNSDLGYEIRVIGAKLKNSTMATTAMYKKLLGVDVSVNFWSYTGVISKMVIAMDTRGDGLLSKSPSQKTKTFLHEVGHTLCLDHPNCGSTAIMQQGFSSPAALTIQTHDKNNLKAKW